MAGCWVILVEAEGEARGPALELETVEQVLAELADRSPSALYAPDRYAVQFLVEAMSAEEALGAGIALWRETAARVGLRDWELVRAELKTTEELAAEHAALESDGVEIGAPRDEHSLAAAYEATRALLCVTNPRQALTVLASLVHRLGGTVVPARRADPRTLPLDISLGEAEPMAPAAEPLSVTRLRLEEILPPVVEDARRVIGLLRVDRAAGPGALTGLEPR
jgi:hypothetical protein